MSQRVHVPDTTGHYVSTPDTAVLGVVGDIDIRVRVKAASYATGSGDFLITKYVATAGNRSWRFGLTSGGNFEFRWSEDGSTSLVANVSPSLTDGVAYWLRVTLDVDNGASNYDCKFWTADGSLENPSAAQFSQVGATQTGSATTSIFDSPSVVSVGSNSSGTEQFAGDYYRSQIYDGIDGTLVADFAGDDFTVGDSDTATAVGAAGLTWTINGTATITIGPPTDLAAVANGANQIDLTWSDVAGNASYSIERSADGTTGWTEVLTPTADATSASDTGLTAATQYFYRIIAVFTAGNSDPSNVDSATTDAAAGPTVAQRLLLLGGG